MSDQTSRQCEMDEQASRRREMELFDRLHPGCREALRNAPYNFDLLSLPKTALNHAIGAPKPAPGRFMKFLEAEIVAQRVVQGGG